MKPPENQISNTVLAVQFSEKIEEDLSTGEFLVKDCNNFEYDKDMKIFIDRCIMETIRSIGLQARKDAVIEYDSSYIR